MRHCVLWMNLLAPFDPLDGAPSTETRPSPPAPELPAIAGTLTAGYTTADSLTATLVDLGRRGYVRVTTQRPTLSPGLTRRECVLWLTKSPDTLTLFEQHLLLAVFGGRRERSLDDLPETLAPDAAQAGGKLCRALARRGYLRPSLPRLRLTTTARGSAAAEEWRQFRRYLALLDPQTVGADAPAFFEAYLGYATAFGMARNWIMRFRYRGTPPCMAEIAWYHLEEAAGPGEIAAGLAELLERLTRAFRG